MLALFLVGYVGTRRVVVRAIDATIPALPVEFDGLRIAQISDLHIGRVDPKAFKIGIDVEQKKYDLPQFLAQKLLGANNVPAVLNSVEPPYFGYQRTELALQTYLALADKDHSPPLPDVAKTLAPGDAYAGAEALAQRLQLLGDLPPGPVPDAQPGIYQGALVDGVKHFQARHGLGSEGSAKTRWFS